MKLLIADDDSMTRIALRKNLQKWGYEIAEAKDGAEAWDILCAEKPPRIAILDWMMPEMEGTEICHCLQKSEKHPFIYTILLTVKRDRDDIVEGLDSGAHDFLSKPVHASELRSRIGVGVRLVQAEDRLRDYAEKMEQFATTDYLTKAYNRRYFFDQAEKELDRARRYKSQFSLLLMDIDHFKKINDTWGHLAGDEVLKRLSKYCKDILRDTDLFARFGGEEFTVLLPETDKDGAFKLAERMRQFIENISVDFAAWSFGFTVSIGVASMKGPAESLEAILKRADDAMYQAKTKGRNQTVKSQ
ncbi:MAG: diguanylate cyclase [Desulfobacteraceae bacterium]|nr:diguanylate cyclase [Desulfobacteraceae bacterium]